MAAENENIKLISKENAEFPDYLDFQKLRSEGIAYLGKLSGKIWTDHNLHDPGITILEILCYAMLDLGYRTNLPTIDILSKNPQQQAKDDNFFSAAQILTNNPLTILDYRKFLIDIKGVRNAWLEIANDQHDFCYSPNNQYDFNAQDYNSSNTILNGLYHVFIDTEKNPKSDFGNEIEANEYLDLLSKSIKDKLMCHRNFCEDFVDITFLCKLLLGVCATIELQNNADPEAVYQNIILKLRDFITPTPKFYTLEQLLDKNIPIDEIYAGRAHNLNQSHGFIDNSELQQIKLKKEIHISELFNIILSVEGVKSVDNLSVRSCEHINFNSSSSWKFQIPVNYVTEFSLKCTELKFKKNGISIDINFKKFEGVLNINFLNSGKVLYQNPSKFLDREIPNGIYHEDLDDYYLLQEDFPRVYGISEGGLPDDVSDHRKAQALQLQGYLLFFDQILAGYLAQLKNIRTLFSMNSSDDPNLKRTYFLNKLADNENLSKLLRFAVGTDSNNDLGNEGNSLIRPIHKSKLIDLIHTNESDIVKPEELELYTFNSLINLQIALNQFKEDLINNQYQFGFLNQYSDNIHYFILGSNDEFALISKFGFESISAANLHLSSVTYVGSFEENYRSFIIDENNVSFDLELNLSTFKSYLALIIEDRDLYHSRRNTFLNHLLARFSEKFTDNVLGEYANKAINSADELLVAKEEFLTQYDDLSANRAKAYNYLQNNWNNLNGSGFELEAKYRAGIKNKKVHSLCNFIVEQLDDYYIAELIIGNEKFFTLNEKFDSEIEAEEAAQLAFNAISNPENLKTKYIAHDKVYSIVLNYRESQYIPFFKQYSTSQEADTVRTSLNRMFANTPKEEVYINSYSYSSQLLNSDQKVVRQLINSFDTAIQAFDAAGKSINKINDSKIWSSEGIDNFKITQLIPNQTDSEHSKYIDVKEFKVNISNSIVGKPKLFTYELLDNSNTFKFFANVEFENNRTAKNHAYLILSLASQFSSYSIDRSSVDSKFKLNIRVDDRIEAYINLYFDTENDAALMRDQIIKTIHNYQYQINTEAEPKGWKFNYDLGYDPQSNYKFSSTKEFKDEESAIKALKSFHQAIPSLRLGKSKNGPILTQQNKGSKLPTVVIHQFENTDLKLLENALNEQKNIAQYYSSSKKQNFKATVRKEASENAPQFIYRLVDKDNVIAVYQEGFSEKKDALLAKKKIYKLLRTYKQYLQLCLGGDIIKEIIGKNNKTKSYKYLIKAHNLQYKNKGPINEELILFESYQTFPTRELALKAFEDTYFQILELAAVESNYGTIISFEESINNQTLVVIPKITQDEIGTYSDGTIQQFMQRLVKTYPIKKFQDQYYFSTFFSEKNPQQWKSTKFYSSTEDAWIDLNFFLMLLKYPGNIFVDCDSSENENATYKIFIREVLAESTEKFYTEEAAWGEEGVEKFICAVQSQLGLHKVQNKNNCCYSFYLNCGPDFLKHPCSYDTAKKRNQVLIKLYDRFKIFLEKKSYSFDSEDNILLLRDVEGNYFARKRIEKSENQYSCTLLFEILEEFQNPENKYVLEGEVIYLQDKVGNVLLESYEKNWDIEDFREKLRQFICYFPISRKLDNYNIFQYSIEIKLPGFNACQEEKLNHCGCVEESEEESICFIAWKSSCPYDSCSEALRMWRLALSLLTNYENYKAILDCSCNTFGIALNYDPQHIAYNPQCYESSQKLCEAVDRTITLCNSEGLHAIEHILLRPRCPEDCDYRPEIFLGQREFSASYIWEVDHSDPCSDDSDIIFRPGIDPYSFISTVVLPAWPERFRTESGKMIMEDILYRMAPAHVLLRILWLSPHEYCCFESKYKDWRKWIAKMNTCNNEFSVRDFMDFLFRRNYKKLHECQDCLPCNSKIQTNISCMYIYDNQIEDNKKSFQDQVNAAFGWMISLEGEYQFFSCDQQYNRDIKPVNKVSRKVKTIKKKPK
ncbi:hypothetical protein M3B46_04085 [Sphingobacterium daejeonense]|uniref:hypothetical protein n=3 Tax=Sphingobacterium daejeonense TaxID=371142 RepID=UPI0021A31CC8|nr:hypothetical protein [Sphingobacterium daejeonense]MCT1530157.1 hypothetical protein [Sphingobacterium daejeonense]